MHQAILGRGREHASLARAIQLRFVRSSSSALPPAVGAGIEDLFAAPIVEAYGMTEGSHQICVNPLPPGERRLGSIGLPAGKEVARGCSGGDGGTLRIRRPTWMYPLPLITNNREGRTCPTP